MNRPRLAGTLLLGGVLSLSVLAGLPSALGGVVPFVAGCSPGLSLSAHPTAGNAPLVVAFSLTALGSAPSSIDWAFGDGSYWNGTGSAYVAPIHRFDHPGTYTTTVAVTQGSQVGRCSETLAVSNGPLQTLTTVVPQSGLAPLTVQFSATVLGGSGTFRAATWSFGDGQAGSGFNLSYTYPAPGEYRATFNVTDSSNLSSTSMLFVNVTAPTGVSRGSPLGGLVPWITGAVVAVGLVIVGTVLYTRSYYGDRSGRLSREGGSGVLVPPTVLVDRAPESPPPTIPTPYVPAAPALDPSPTPPSSGPSLPPPRPTPFIEPALPPLIPPGLPTAPPPEQFERLRLSQRVVLNIYSLGTLRDDEIAPPSFTQAGMSEKLSVGQSPLSNVLRRLVMAGVLTQDVRHVRGRPRRLRVYRLTAMGEDLALELRRQREGHRPPNGRGPAS